MSDNPRAFPSAEIDDAFGGLTLRDWFAGQALNGCLSYSNYNEAWGDYHNNVGHDDLAAKVYSIADAMITERAKP